MGRHLGMLVCVVCLGSLLLAGCAGGPESHTRERESFKLRPEVEDQYGYTHAIRVGDRLMISGAVSMDDQGRPTAAGDLRQQMLNCYTDLDKVLRHYGCTFGDVVVENIFTTNMPEFLSISGHRASVYPDGYPTGTWLEVKGLALPEFMIEIELEAHCPRR